MSGLQWAISDEWRGKTKAEDRGVHGHHQERGHHP